MLALVLNSGVMIIVIFFQAVSPCQIANEPPEVAILLNVDSGCNMVQIGHGCGKDMS